MMTKIYNAMLLNHIEPEIEKILRKNQNAFRRNWPTTSHILTIYWILGVCAKNPEAILLFIDFSKAFDSIHRGMEQIILVNSLLKETVTAIMMFYRNKNIIVRSTDEDKDFFDIVAGVPLGDTLA